MPLKSQQDHQPRPRRRALLTARRLVTPVASVAAISTIVSVSGIALVNSPPAAAAFSIANFSAGSTAGVLDLTVLAAMDLSAGDISLGDAVGATNRQSAKRSAALATNLDGTLVTALPLGDILSTTQQVAPPDNPTPATADVIPFTETPLLSLGVSNASASARWIDDSTCLPGNVPLTRSRVSTANVSVLPIPGAGAPLVSIPETVAVTQTTSLVEEPGSTSARVVQARSRGSIVQLDLLGEISVQVVTAPLLTATASGKAGGAAVTYDAPVVTVTLPGAPPITLPANGSPVDFESPDNPLLGVELRIGQVKDLIEIANGTKASATASVLKVKLSALSVLGAGGITLAKLDLFPMAVAANAPVGGVVCPPPVTPTPTPTPTPSPCGGSSAADFDQDGLTGLEETSGSRNPYGNKPTDPCNADSDGDGIKDGTEVFGSNISDVVIDCGRAKKPIGTVVTDPNDRDTDNDHLSDGKEIGGFYIKQRVFTSKAKSRAHSYVIGRVHTNPLRKDTDRDGVRDRAEKRGTKNKKFNKAKSDPRNCDTDLGGNKDGKEIRKGSNPSDRGSSPKNPRGKQ